MKHINSYIFLMLLAFASCNCFAQNTTANDNKEHTFLYKKQLNPNPAFNGIKQRAWWKEDIVYQIYPRSFKDSDGDGIGDIKGIISKLDYLKSLGIGIVWLSPCFASPNDDNGYDISNYKAIMKEFGTMQDFDNMLKGMHDRGIKLVLDLVANHSSDEHEWFKQSRSSRTNPYREYYHWWPAERGKPAHRWSFFDVNEDAWKYDSLTNAYYLHYFSQKQPDLNWENPKLRQEIYSIMRFWFDKGVDGFRMDVIPYISKDTSFPPIPKSFNGDYVGYYSYGPHLHDYLQEMNKEVLCKYDITTVAEGIGVNADRVQLFVAPERNELQMLYQGEALGNGMLPREFKKLDPKGYSLPVLKKVYTKWDSIFALKGWNTIFLANHDQPRMVTRWGNDNDQYRELSSKLLTTFIMSMRGTAYYYNGDELGMSNIKFDSIGDYKDIESINRYKFLQKTGGDLQGFIEAQKMTARDNSRTPMQWDNQKNAGFSSGTPWLKVNSNYTWVNVDSENKDAHSVLNYCRKMVQLHKSSPALIYGQYQVYDIDDPFVYAYTRTQGKERMLIVLNFSNKVVDYQINSSVLYKGMKERINNYSSTTIKGRTVTLKPWQAIIYQLF